MIFAHSLPFIISYCRTFFSTYNIITDDDEKEFRISKDVNRSLRIPKDGSNDREIAMQT